MDLEGRLRHVAVRIEVAMPHPARRDAVDQLDTADLDDAMTGGGIEPRGFSVEHDLAHSELCLSRLFATEAAP